MTRLATIVCSCALALFARAQTDTTFTYQGELKDAGTPAGGTYDMDFVLYDAPVGGSVVGSGIAIPSVQATDGLFSVELDFGANAFGETQLWLEIAVEGTTLSPRQPITHAPYAIQTRGIFVDANNNIGIGTTTPSRNLDIEADEATLRLTSTNTSPSKVSQLQLKSAGLSIFTPFGAINFFDETDTLRAAITANASGASAGQISMTVDPGALPELRVLDGAVRIVDTLEIAQGTTGTITSRIAVNGDDSYLQLDGGNLGIGTDTPLFPLHIRAAQPYTRYEDADGGSDWVTGVQGPSVGYNIQEVGVGTHLVINQGGDVGIGTTAPTTRLDVRGSGTGAADAIQGWATAASGSTIGVSGIATSPDGTGVNGFSNDGIGVAGSSVTSHGVVGTSIAGRGVYGQSNSGNGVYGQTSTSRGVLGVATNTSGVNWGVRGITNSTSGFGVWSDGDFGGTGAKYFVQPHPTNPAQEIRFVCLEGNESGTYFRGSTHLEQGRAYIEVPEEFRLVSEAKGLTVQLTPRGPNADLWIESSDLDQIVVVGNGNVAFDYFVNGVRRGYADLQSFNDNTAYIPQVRGIPYATQLRPGQRQLLVNNGILNADFTPNEATAARMGWPLRDPTDDERRAATTHQEARK